MLTVGALEQVELARHAPVLVGEERERRADAGAERAVDVRRVDRDRDERAVLALDLLLHRDEHARSDLLLRAPPAA